MNKRRSFIKKSILGGFGATTLLSCENLKDKIELTEKLNQLLEQMIKKNPNQWIWSHNRWR